VHLCTLDDFEIICSHLQIRILGRHVMAGGKDVRVMPNLLGSTAVYRFKRES
jgi:hypothetical protein